MILYWTSRIITGDTLFGGSIWAACVVAFYLAGLARWPRWAQGLYFVALSFGLMVLAHYAIDALQLWWVTPLGEPLQIIKR